MISKLDIEWCANENAGSPKGVDCEIPTSIGEGNETFFIRVYKSLPIRRVLKL